ncbi:unnamed protein product [Blepharisma stoltei]|uniref:SCP domain-containing protein n=1 Tax=Blepharisma stoltei TaxID=1481888 RepID=A0AAU9IZG5_9CILI|nr:unnamed protein product [Blepharisma stoltei]
MDTQNICQEVLTELNIARTRPHAYADKISSLLPRFRGKELHMPGQPVLLTKEGPSAVQECINALRSAEPLEMLTWSNGLARAAQDHCNDQGLKGKMGHNGSDGSSPADRAKRYGSGNYIGGENIDYGSNVATEIVSSLLIDDGVSNRGHRENILNSRYNFAGVGLGPHKVYRFMCTIDFAGTYTESENGQNNSIQSGNNLRNSPQQNRNNSPKSQDAKIQQPKAQLPRAGKVQVSPTNARVKQTSPGPQPASKQPINSNINRPSHIAPPKPQPKPTVSSNPKPAIPTKTPPQKPTLSPESLSSLQHAVLEELNQVRTNPRGYASHVTEILKYYHGNMFQKPGEITIVTQEGPAAVRECVQVLGSTSPICPFQFSEGLSKAAQDHCNDTGPKGKTGHSGTDGSSMGSRIERYGNWNTCIGENIDYGNSTAREIILALLIDDGVSSRGHRTNILNPNYRIVGIGYGPHAHYHHMCTIDFAGGFTDSSNHNSHEEPYPRNPLEPKEENKWSSEPPEEDKNTYSTNPSDLYQDESTKEYYSRCPSFPDENLVEISDPQKPGCKLLSNNPTAYYINKNNMKSMMEDMMSEGMPEGAVSMKTTREMSTRNGKVTVKTVKLFTFQDGSTKRVETITESSQM